MKKLLCFVCAAALLAACSDDDSNEITPAPSTTNPETPNPEPEPDKTEIISFESAEGMLGVDGNPVALGDADVAGSFAGGIYPHVYWFESLADYSSLLDEDLYSYDGPLFSTADGNAWFGSTYLADENYGDSWSGFAVSADYGKTMPGTGYPQFTVWSESGACGSSTCAVGFYGPYYGVYGTPTIEFAERPRKVSYCHLANTLIAHEYVPTAVEAAAYYYRIVITGSLKGEETGKVTCALAENGSRADDWVKVDLSSLGEVDKLTIVPESNEANDWGLLAPAYFALDEIGLEPVEEK